MVRQLYRLGLPERRNQGNRYLKSPFPPAKQVCRPGDGLHYNFFRYCEPEAGRFVNPDPIGVDGCDNLYWFVPNVQIWVDFLGLAKGAANPVVKATIEVGKRVHKNYYFTLGGGYDFESSFRTKSGKLYRFDAIDYKNCIVRELKPDTKSGRCKGNKQLNNYVRVLNSEGPDSCKGKWKGILDLYKP